MEDLYSLLGIDRNASQDEIKKAYKKLALKYHPDRLSGKSESERAKGEEEFKKINAAYSILSDEDKKAHYDRFGTVDGMDNGGFDMGGMFSHFADMFGDMGFNPFGGRSRRYSNKAADGEDIVITVNISAKELLMGCEKTVSYTKNRRCSECNGTGGTGVKRCSHCNGTGMITKTIQIGPGQIMTNSSPCPYCQGSGQIVENICHKCHGSGFESEKVSKTIKIPAGVPNGGMINVGRFGSDSKDKSGLCGNLIIRCIWGFDSQKYTISNNEFYELLEIPYYFCILGGKYKIKLANDEETEINIKEFSQAGDKITIRYKGIHNGDYIIIIKPKLPDYISDEERNLLNQIKDANS